jgi:phosphatidylinositol alpha-mannosyltransferase
MAEKLETNVAPAGRLGEKWKMREVKPRSVLDRLRLFAFQIFGIGYQILIGLYVAYALLSNSVWKISDSSRKSKKKRDPSRPLKVGVVSEFYYPHMGGLSGDVHYACAEFARKGYDVKLITSNVAPEFNTTRNEKYGFEIIRIGKSLPVWANGSLAKVSFAWNIGSQIKKMIERENFDIIHVHCPMTPVLPLLVQRYADCPVIGHLHAMLLTKPLLFKVFHRFTQSVFNDFDGKIAVSHTCAKPLIEWFGGEWEIIPNGIPVDEILESKARVQKFDDGVKNIFWIGRLEPRNGLSLMIQAFDMVHSQEPNTRLILAGDGPLRPFFEAEVPERIRPHVHFLGAILEEKWDYFRTTHVNVVPTNRIASLGVALLEAMMSGAPTVASHLPAFCETYEPGEDVLVAHPDSPQEFADQILKLLRDPLLSQKLALKAQKKMIERFSWRAIIDRVDTYSLPFIQSAETDESHQQVRTK